MHVSIQALQPFNARICADLVSSVGSGQCLYLGFHIQESHISINQIGTVE